MLINIGNFADYQDWTKRTAGKVVSIDFVRFGMVGTTGFIVNTIFLSLFYKILHIPIFVSQLMAAEIALISNFTLHNIWTYKTSLGDGSWFKRLVLFHGSSWAGVLITTTVLVLSVKVFHINYLLGLIAGSATAMTWNFVWSKYYIFKKG